MENFDQLLADYIVELTEKHKARNDREYPNLQETYNGKYNVFGVDHGPKFAKITIRSGGEEGQKSVHCFVEKATGDIYKAESWDKKAKGVRGNLANERRPIFSRDYYKIL